MIYAALSKDTRNVLSAATRQKCCTTADGYNARNAICIGFQSPQNGFLSVYTGLLKPSETTRNLAIV